MKRILNPKLVELATLLSENSPIDGDTLGEHLGITRAAVWKMIKRLGEYHIDITARKGKGYSLEQPLYFLNPDVIRRALTEVDTIEVFETLPSTNTHLRFNADPNHISLCLSEHQSGGRGRFDRQWDSPFGENLYFSLGFPFKKNMTQLSGMPLVVGIAVCNALKTIAPNIDYQIKWPNDIFMNKTKGGGILIEIQGDPTNHCFAVIGVGININRCDDKYTDYPWTSLKKRTGKTYDRSSIVIQIIRKLIESLQKFDNESFEAFMPEWNHYDYLATKEVKLQAGKQIIQGRCKGVNREGHLLLEYADGKTKAFASGEASLQTPLGLHAAPHQDTETS